MNTQLWVQAKDSLPLEKCAFAPVTTGERTYRMKPETGGLWTSTYDGEHGSAWIQWCITERFECDPDLKWGNCALLEPVEDARVYEIDTYLDLKRLCDNYRPLSTHTHEPEAFCSICESMGVNWEAIAKDYDAIHLTEDGQWATRLSHPYNLYGWDCESTIWLNWKFSKVESLGACTFRPRVEDEVAA